MRGFVAGRILPGRRCPRATAQCGRCRQRCLHSQHASGIAICRREHRGQAWTYHGRSSQRQSARKQLGSTCHRQIPPPRAVRKANLPPGKHIEQRRLSARAVSAITSSARFGGLRARQCRRPTGACRGQAGRNSQEDQLPLDRLASPAERHRERWGESRVGSGW